MAALGRCFSALCSRAIPIAVRCFSTSRTPLDPRIWPRGQGPTAAPGPSHAQNSLLGGGGPKGRGVGRASEAVPSDRPPISHTAASVPS
eukprot:6855080-Alexandrium_andersonii.AAC.1